MTVPLFFRRFRYGKDAHARTDDAPVLIVLHGLFGSSDNWGSIGKALSDQFDVFLVDQRDHGRSPHTTEVGYDAMALDLERLVAEQNLDRIILVGHSMGGKTAMRFAQLFPQRVAHLMVIDIGPREHANNQTAIVNALLQCDLQHLRTRKEVESHLAAHIPEPGVVQFLLKSLYWSTPEQLAWRFNAPLLAQHMPAVLASVGPELVLTPTLFLRGGMSDYILREDVPAIREQFPNCRVETIAYAGHWVHAQAPEEVMELIRALP
jgi:esterase